MGMRPMIWRDVVFGVSSGAKQPAPVSPVLFVWHLAARADRDLVFQDAHVLLAGGFAPS
jgi:hypothetical protein